MKKTISLYITVLSIIFIVNSSHASDELNIINNQGNLILAQFGGLNCGVKPVPRVGYRIGRCINGQWEQVSSGYSSGINCGVKPVPRVGYRIGRCINGQWEQVSDGFSSGINCGVKPVPRVGYRIGRCINGQWEQVSR